MPGFKHRTKEDLAQIVAHGGGLRIDGTYRTTEDLCFIVSHAGSRKPLIVIFGVLHKTTEDLAKIAAHGQGSVHFED